jgi:hypothetical protein
VIALKVYIIQHQQKKIISKQKNILKITHQNFKYFSYICLMDSKIEYIIDILNDFLDDPQHKLMFHINNNGMVIITCEINVVDSFGNSNIIYSDYVHSFLNRRLSRYKLLENIDYIIEQNEPKVRIY